MIGAIILLSKLDRSGVGGGGGGGGEWSSSSNTPEDVAE